MWYRLFWMQIFYTSLHIFGTKSVNLCFLRFLTLKALFYADMYKCNQRGFCNWCIERFTKCKWFCPFNDNKNFRGRVVVRFSALAWNERQLVFFSNWGFCAIELSILLSKSHLWTLAPDAINFSYNKKKFDNAAVKGIFVAILISSWPVSSGSLSAWNTKTNLLFLSSFHQYLI